MAKDQRVKLHDLGDLKVIMSNIMDSGVATDLYVSAATITVRSTGEYTLGEIHIEDDGETVYFVPEIIE